MFLDEKGKLKTKWVVAIGAVSVISVTSLAFWLGLLMVTDFEAFLKALGKLFLLACGISGGVFITAWIRDLIEGSGNNA